MAEISTLSVVINADTRGAEQGLQRVSQQVSGFGSMLAGIGAGIGMKVFDTMAAGFQSAAGAAIGFNSNLEQSTIAFTSMLGSAEKAQSFLAEMKQFAATTPFEFPDLLQASKQMMAFGFAAKDVKPLLTAVGSAASAMGTGRSGVDSITKALGQMKAATVVQAGELNQLTEQGIPAFQILADKLGITTGEVKKMASEGKIASDVFIEAFQAWAGANYGDMMAKQALTFEGAMSTIKDSVQFAMADAFKPFFEVLSAGAVELSKFVQSDTFGAWAKSVADGTREAFRQIADAVRTVIQVFDEGWLPSDEIDPFVNEVGKIATVIRDVARAVQPAIEIIGRGFEGLVIIVQQALTGNVAAALDNFVALVVMISGELVEVLAQWGQAFINWVAPMIPPFLAAVANIGLQLVTWIGAQLPAIGAQLLLWAQQFIAWVQPMIPPLLAALMVAGQALLAWIAEQIPPIIAQLVLWAQQFVAWVAPLIPPMMAALAAVGAALLGWLAEQIPPLIAQLALWGIEFVNWVGPQVMPMLAELGKLALALIDWLIAQIPGITAKLVEWGLLFGAWVLTSAIPAWNKESPKINAAIGEWIIAAASELGRRIWALGEALVTGIYNGFVNAWATIGPKIKEAINSAFTMPSFGFGGGGASSGGGSVGRTFSLPAGTSAGGTRVAGGGGQVNQFNLGLSPGEAEAACGPAALAWFMNMTGRTPTGAEARDLARQAGWDASAGMYGSGAFRNAAASAGIPTGTGNISELAASGQPFVISTPGHYFQVSGGDPNTGLNVGGSGTALRGGSEVMTLQQIEQLMGPVNDVIVPLLSRDMERRPLGGGAGGGSEPFGPIGLLLEDAKENMPPWLAELAKAQTGIAGMSGEVTTTTSQMGNYIKTVNTDMAGNYVTTLTDMSGRVITQYSNMADQVGGLAAQQTGTVLQSTNMMADGTALNVQRMADGTIATTTRQNDTIVTTITGMSGEILRQTATMADGTVLRMSDMGVQTATSVNEMAGTITTTMTTLSGTTIATTTTMNGVIVAQTVTTSEQMKTTWVETSAAIQAVATEMGARVMGESRVMGEYIVTTMKDKTGEMVEVVTDAAGNVVSTFKNMADAAGKSVKSGLDIARKGFEDLIKSMKKAENQAEDTRSALERLGGQHGGSSGSKGKGRTGGVLPLAAGGPVNFGEMYLVGEDGPELFSPSRSGTIIPNHAIGGLGSYDVIALDLRIDGRTAERIYVEGKQLAIRRGRE